MLPDFPKTKLEISELLNTRVRLKIKALSPFAALPRTFTQHEGNVLSYPQEGSGRVTHGFESFGGTRMLQIDEIPKLVGEKLLQKIDWIAEEIAKQFTQHGFRVLDKAAEQTGNRIDANGKPFDKEMFLQMLESVEMTFDESGKPELVLLMHPDMAKVVQELGPSWEQDPVFKKRHSEVLMVKREEWRDRESNRKLVD